MINTSVNNGLSSVAGTDTKTLVEQPQAADVSRLSETSQKEDPSVKALPTGAPDPQELASAVSKLNDYVQNIQRTLSFSVEETIGVTVVQVYDSETEELIRQIPAEETIKLAASIEDRIANLFLKEQA